MRRCTGEGVKSGKCEEKFFLFSEIGQEIKRSQQLIVQYKEELKKSRVIRKHRQEYDAMAKVQ